MSVSISPSKVKETWYTTNEAAKILRVSTDTVKRYCNQSPPRIKGEKLFGKQGQWYIPQSAIDKYMESTSATGRPKAARRRRRSA